MITGDELYLYAPRAEAKSVISITFFFIIFRVISVSTCTNSGINRNNWLTRETHDYNTCWIRLKWNGTAASSVRDFKVYNKAMSCLYFIVYVGMIPNNLNVYMYIQQSRIYYDYVSHCLFVGFETSLRYGQVLLSSPCL